MRKVLLSAVACFYLTSCASVSRVKSLEARMSSVEQGLTAQGSRIEAVDALSRGTSTKLAVLEGKTSSIETRVGELERYISWSGRFDVAVEPDQKWHVLYANSTGESQRLRMRKAQGAGTSSVRVGVISRIADDAGGDIPTGVTPPPWDMSGVGSQRWLRLGCGQEVSGKAEGTPARFEILVTRDANPVKC